MAAEVGLENIYKYIKNLIESMEVIPTAGQLPSYRELRSSPDKFYECSLKQLISITSFVTLYKNCNMQML